jgi:polyisoprenoid-binding protein YceI
MKTMPSGSSSRALTLILMAFGMVAAPAQAAVYLIDSQHTVPRFVHQRGSLVLELGRFERTRGVIAYDEQTRSGAVDLTVDAHSAATGSGLLNSLLSGPLFLDAHRFPEVRFQSSAVIFENGRPVRIEGILTIRDVTRAVVLQVQQFRINENAERGKPVLTGYTSTNIRRSDYGMGRFVPLIGDEIRLEIAVEAFLPQ